MPCACELGLVRLEPQVGEQAGVHARMQGAHASVERLRIAGEVADLGDRDGPACGDGLRGRAGRHDLDAGGGERGGEFEEPGLVAHRDEGPPDRHEIALAVEGGVDRAVHS